MPDSLIIVRSVRVSETHNMVVDDIRVELTTLLIHHDLIVSNVVEIDIEQLIDQPPNDDTQTIETIVIKPPTEVSLGRSHRERTSVIPDYYVVSLQRSESYIGICN